MRTQEFRTRGRVVARLPLFSTAGSFNERERRILINPPAKKASGLAGGLSAISFFARLIFSLENLALRFADFQVLH